MSRYAHVGIHRKYMCLQEAKFSYIIYDRNTRTHLRGQGSVMSTVTHPLRHHDNLTTHDALRSKCIVWIEPRREVPFKKGKLFVEVGLWRVYWMTCSGEWKRQPQIMSWVVKSRDVGERDMWWRDIFLRGRRAISDGGSEFDAEAL